MTCPRCDTVDLAAEDRHEIAIDRCPTCGGVWLDHGELEKIVAYMRQFEPRSTYGTSPEERPSTTKGARGHVWDVIQEAFSWLPWS